MEPSLNFTKPDVEKINSQAVPPLGKQRYTGYLSDVGLIRSNSPGIPLLKKDEINKLRQTFDVRVEIFNLSNKEELNRYNIVWDGIAKGIYVLSKEDMQWIPEEKNWRVFLRYAIVVAEAPSLMRERINLENGDLK